MVDTLDEQIKNENRERFRLAENGRGNIYSSIYDVERKKLGINPDDDVIYIDTVIKK